MYWPIGAPRIHAASHNALKGKPQSVSFDHEEQVSTENNGAKVYGASERGEAEHDDREAHIGGAILAVQLSRNGNLFVTITRSTLTVWQTKPTVVVASVLRSAASLKTYGENVDVLLRPDTEILVIQTSLGYLITYSLATDPSARLYHTVLPQGQTGHARRRSVGGKLGSQGDSFNGPGEGNGVGEYSIRFRMVIKVDAGISKALALDDELIIATIKPPAVQCVRWIPDSSGTQTTTVLLKSLSWPTKKTYILDIVHDRPMNLSSWITSDGKCYAVQKSKSKPDIISQSDAYKGYCFHAPDSDADRAVKVSINARFSLVAVGDASGDIRVYNAKDYAGHIPLSHTLARPVSPETSGAITSMSYSPDGYALFVGYENGWAMWSVYGKPGACSFTADRFISTRADESWLLGVADAFWIGGGCQIMLLNAQDNRLWIMDIARSAVAGCFSSANVSRSLLQTPTGFMIYRGYDLPNLGAISIDTGLWNQVQIPAEYAYKQWPIRSSVVSADGRYVAVSGRRGLAHYSVSSGRWKTFADQAAEDDFTVRGGMCWHQHVLIAAVESNEGFQIRVYSRERALDSSSIMHVEPLSAPIVHIALSGEDSLLAYSLENQLYHYIIHVSNAAVRLVQVGQIALHGIIRAPLRVRALSWILPEDQIENGDPSLDVGIATIVFLVDGKLVVLQPSTTDDGRKKYDMRIVAQNVEFYVLMRDQQHFNHKSAQLSVDHNQEAGISKYHQNDLRDSLWYFDGIDMQVWTDTQELLASAPPELGRELPTPIKITTDFYPLSILLNKAILFGIEPDMTQRRDMGFSILRFATRTKLFLPQILRHHLSQYNSPSALFLAQYYQHLEYLSHALEILLHDVLDEEVDFPPKTPEQAVLPSVVALLSSFEQFLDIIVQCTRKTEVRSWSTLFKHLPTPRELFNESLEKGRLKTAGGYLLVLHTLDELDSGEEQVFSLLERAKEAQDWELCKELARFLMAMDSSGETLRKALEQVGFGLPKG